MMPLPHTQRFQADDAELKRYADLMDYVGIGFLLRAPDGTMVLRNAQADALLGGVATPRWVDEEGLALAAEALPAAQALATGQAVRGRVLGVSDGENVQRWLRADALPVFADDGALHRVMLTLVDVSKRKQLESTVQALSIREDATGAYTYPYALHLLEEEIHRARRYGTPFTLAVIEMDKLAQTEQRLGTPATDAALDDIARQVRKCLREIDIVARKSRSEVLVLLPNVRMHDGIIGLERARSRIEADDRENAKRGITISGGVTEYAGENAAALIERAESLLVHAREAGPNHFCQDIDIF
ncbi:MAG: hypothetical protein BGO63_19165 [Candidatus Accumulibacter sp. 66-26]|nr:GGDEF domain-containing protein [Accumulibacter sp.]OJW52005.1 MAG: hypothetical protein BGO63_19165 [Candidatus Accumulibacter sp. 66-26]